MVHILQNWCWVLVLSGAYLLSPTLCTGQIRDIRNQSEYHDGNLSLKSKGEFYYDFWSEQEIRHGKYSEWDKDGNLMLECTYHEGQLAGVMKRYYPNGEQREISHWQNGSLTGQQLLYDRSGILRTRATYLDGKLQGNFETFFPHGGPKSIIPFSHGQKQGEARYFDTKGQEKDSILFHQGRRVKPPKESEPPEKLPPSSTNTPDSQAPDKGASPQQGKSRKQDKKNKP